MIIKSLFNKNILFQLKNEFLNSLINKMKNSSNITTRIQEQNSENISVQSNNNSTGEDYATILLNSINNQLQEQQTLLQQKRNTKISKNSLIKGTLVGALLGGMVV